MNPFASFSPNAFAIKDVVPILKPTPNSYHHESTLEKFALKLLSASADIFPAK